jgi:predicted DNA-binding transcriptional regulator YafY
LVRDFSPSEIWLLIDSLLFSKYIPNNQCKDLIEKLKNLLSIYFEFNVQHIRSLPENIQPNRQHFYTIEVLDEAIAKGKQVVFTYNEFGTDKKLHPRKNAEGREYIVNPYQLVIANGRYYLICNYDKYDNTSNYKVNRITDIRILDTPVKPMERVIGLEKGLDLSRHMAEHIYMFAGESVAVKFRASSSLAGEIIDWFGQKVTFANDTGLKVDVHVRVNEKAFVFLALQYGKCIEVLEPKSIRNQVKNIAAEILKKYEE